MIKKIKSALERVTVWLGSQTTWRIILGFFLLETVWFVFSAQYPMAFDENYHFGLIKLHAAQWLPFFTSQPHDAGVYGAVVRDPSYLYHWLMSFPYRLIAQITDSLVAQVIFLRLLNVAMVAGALMLYRRIIDRIGVSAPLRNSIFAIFILIPVVPFLAAHINYDNLFMLAVAGSLLLTMKIMEGLRAHQIDMRALLYLFSVLCLSSIIKYPFLPVLVVIVLFLIWYAWRNKMLRAESLKLCMSGFAGLGKKSQIALIALAVVSFGLFAERYVGNVLIYHDPVPSCGTVISEDECMQYGPYGRDKVYAAEKSADFHPNLFVYGADWLWGMWYRLFFAINFDYATMPPLIIIGYLAVLLAVVSLVGIVLRFKTLFRSQPLRLLLLWLVLGYGLILFEDGFSAYIKTAQPVAINGRYWIPFLLFIFAFGGLAWSQILQRRQALKAGIAGFVIALFLLQGGGTMTFIVQSADTWLWDNSAVRTANRTVRSAAWPFIIGKGLL